MQNDMHENWQSEEDSPVPVTIRKPSAPQMVPKQSGTEISRRPAAIVGMLLVFAVGFGFFSGLDQLRGQIANTSNQRVVHITNSGFSPSTLNVEHGQTITFINDQNIPQIIESDTLCSDTGFCLMTKSLYNGDSDNFTITPDMQQGSYRYASIVDSAMVGTIVITTNVPSDFADITSILSEELLRQAAGSAPVGSTDGFGFGFDPSDFAPSNTAGSVTFNDNIPTNPYTIDSTRVHPFDSSGNPIPEAFGDDPNTPVRELAANTSTQNILNPTKGPVKQPSTGSEVWIVILGSILGICYVTRNAFAKTSL